MSVTSDSEDSRPKRNRVRTARYIDEVPTPQVAKLIAKKRKRNQQHQAHLADIKRLSVASEPYRATDDELQGPTISSARVARDSSGIPRIYSQMIFCGILHHLREWPEMVVVPHLR